jgi:hypothetical protein
LFFIFSELIWADFKLKTYTFHVALPGLRKEA